MDLADLKSVEAFAVELGKRTKRVDILVGWDVGVVVGGWWDTLVGWRAGGV